MVSGFLKRFQNVFFQVINTGFFFIRPVVADNHSANVDAFNILLEKLEEDKKYNIIM